MQLNISNSIFKLKSQVRINIQLICVSIICAFLTACQGSSLSEGLQSVNTPKTQQVVAPQTPTLPTTPNGIQNGTQIANLPATKSVAFLPVSNAPQSAVSSLSSSIRSAATQNQVKIVNSIQDGATYQVKGYFSALEDGAGTLLVYVWDVLDKNNKRVYRISGQERTNKKTADPWAAINNQMITKVANSSLSQLKSWLSSRG